MVEQGAPSRTKYALERIDVRDAPGRSRVNTPAERVCMHSSTVTRSAGGNGKHNQPRNREAGPGSFVIERGLTRACARAGRSIHRRPGAALGDVPALTGGGGSRLARVLALPLLARFLSKCALRAKARFRSKLADGPRRKVVNKSVHSLSHRLRSARVFNMQVIPIILK